MVHRAGMPMVGVSGTSARTFVATRRVRGHGTRLLSVTIVLVLVFVPLLALVVFSAQTLVGKLRVQDGF
jgi:hypothetical protein